MQTIQHEGARVETGAVQFGDDWPGVFIRGDNAFALAMSLQALLSGRDDPLTRAQAGGLLSLLRSSNLHGPTPTPENADVVEAVARAIAPNVFLPFDPNLHGSPVNQRNAQAMWRNNARAAIAAIAALQSSPAEPAGEEPVAWMYKNLYLGARHILEERDSGRYKGWTETPLYARPATPSNPDRLVEALRDIRQAAQIAAAIEGEEDGETYAMIAARADAALSAPALDGEKGE